MDFRSRLFSARAWQALLCFAFFLLSSPTDSWAQDNSARPTDGRELTWGEPASGHPSGAERAPAQDREIQYWAFEAQAGEMASIRLKSDDFDALLYVAGSGRPQFGRDQDDVAGSLNAELTVAFPETGTYYVGVEPLGRRPTRSYSLEAVRLDPNHWEAHYRWGNTLRRSRDPGRATQAYHEALRLDPSEVGSIGV